MIHNVLSYTNCFDPTKLSSVSAEVSKEDVKMLIQKVQHWYEIMMLCCCLLETNPSWF